MFCQAVGSFTNAAVPATGPAVKYPSRPANSGCNAATSIFADADAAAVNSASEFAAEILWNASKFFAIVMRGPSATTEPILRLDTAAPAIRIVDLANIFFRLIIRFRQRNKMNQMSFRMSTTTRAQPSNCEKEPSDTDNDGGRVQLPYRRGDLVRFSCGCQRSLKSWARKN